MMKSHTKEKKILTIDQVLSRGKLLYKMRSSVTDKELAEFLYQAKQTMTKFSPDDVSASKANQLREALKFAYYYRADKNFQIDTRDNLLTALENAKHYLALFPEAPPNDKFYDGIKSKYDKHKEDFEKYVLEDVLAQQYGSIKTDLTNNELISAYEKSIKFIEFFAVYNEYDERYLEIKEHCPSSKRDLIIPVYEKALREFEEKDYESALKTAKAAYAIFPKNFTRPKSDKDKINLYHDKLQRLLVDINALRSGGTVKAEKPTTTQSDRPIGNPAREVYSSDDPVINMIRSVVPRSPTPTPRLSASLSKYGHRQTSKSLELPKSPNKDRNKKFTRRKK